MELDLTRGRVLKNVVRFSLPYLLSYFLQTLYGMADLFIIGQYAGVEATTAVSVGSQVMHMLTLMIVGLAMGTTVSVCRRKRPRAHCRWDRSNRLKASPAACSGSGRHCALRIAASWNRASACASASGAAICKHRNSMRVCLRTSMRTL